MSGQLAINLSIDVPDLSAGLAFYGGVFGLSEVARPFATMAVLDGGNLKICMHEKAEASESSPGSGARRAYARHWTPVHMDFHVPRLRPLLDAIRAGGGSVEQEFHGHGPRPTAFCCDPFGNGFCVIAQSLD